MSTELSIELTQETIRRLDDCAYTISQAKTSIAWKLIDIGRELATARQLFGPYNAEFIAWAKDSCGISRTRCYEAIQAFEKFGLSSTLDGFTVSAIVALSRDSVPQEVRDTAIEMAESGEPVTKAVAEKLLGKEPTNERSVAPVRTEPETDDLGDADDFDDEPEDPTEVVPEPARPAKAKPKESNVIGDSIRQVTMELEFATEGLADFQVQAIYEGVRLWMAADLEKRGLKP